MSERRLHLASLLAAALAACGGPPVRLGPYEHDAQAVTICPAGATLQGADVSSYQATVNWSQYAASGLTFAIAKATEGLTGVTAHDLEFPSNWAGMKQAGVVRGAYHFYHPQDDGAAQADSFLAEVASAGGFQPGDLPPFLDFEVTDNQPTATIVQRAQDFIDEIQAKTGLTTIIYTYPSYWSGLGNPSQFGKYPLWMASYATCPDIPAPWNGWLFWQNSSTATVAGIPNSIGTMDTDEFNGSLAQLQQIEIGGSGIPDAGPPGTPDAGTPPAALPSWVLSQVSGNDAITLVNWSDGHLELFGLSTSGAELHSATTGTGDTWSTPAALDTGALCGSAASYWGSPWTYPELYSPLAAGGTGHLWWASSSGWRKYQAFGGGTLGHLATVVWVDGRTEVFALGADHAIWHDYWDVANSNWSGWASLGGSVETGAAPIVWPDGSGELFAADGAGGLWHATTGPSSSTGWSSWTQIGSGIASRPAPVRWPDGHVELFARGTDGQLYHATATSPSAWSGLSVLGAGTSLAGDPSAVMDPASGAEVFARDTTGQVQVLVEDGGNGFAPLAGMTAASDPFGWEWQDGSAEVFAVDGTGQLVHTLHDPANGWSGWSGIGTGFAPCATPLAVATDAGTPGGGTGDAGVPGGGTSGGSGGGSGTSGSGGTGGTSGSGAAAGGGSSGTPGSGATPKPNPPKPATGCGCRTGEGPDLAVLALAALVFVEARRRRPTGR